MDKKMGRITTIIFDLDGTLVDAYEAIAESINFTLGRLAHPQISAGAARRAVGSGDKNFIEKFVPRREAKKALAIYRRHHGRALKKYARVIPEVRRILRTLKRRKHMLGIVSNRPEKFSKIILKNLGLVKYFDIILCAKTKREMKPSPKLLLRAVRKMKGDTKHTLYVGDMVIDVYAGKNAAIKTVAIAGGSSSRTELRRARPAKIITKLSQLLNIV